MVIGFREKLLRFYRRDAPTASRVAESTLSNGHSTVRRLPHLEGLLLWVVGQLPVTLTPWAATSAMSSVATTLSTVQQNTSNNVAGSIQRAGSGPSVADLVKRNSAVNGVSLRYPSV